MPVVKKAAVRAVEKAAATAAKSVVTAPDDWPFEAKEPRPGGARLRT